MQITSVLRAQGVGGAAGGGFGGAGGMGTSISKGRSPLRSQVAVEFRKATSSI